MHAQRRTVIDPMYIEDADVMNVLTIIMGGPEDLLDWLFDMAFFLSIYDWNWIINNLSSFNSGTIMILISKFGVIIHKQLIKIHMIKLIYNQINFITVLEWNLKRTIF